MKKITAFFMALMPVFVVTLLFVCGLIVKSSTHVNVTAVEVVNNEISQNVRDLSKADPIQIQVNVLPKNASNPEVFYESSNPTIAEVNDQGLVTPKDYGECYIYAFSKENETLNSKAKLEIGDTIYHDITIDNKESISYVGLAQTNKLQITTKPKSTTVKNPNLNITSSDESVVKVTTDGLLIPQSESGESTITVETQASAEQPSIKQTVDVKIGPGVEQLDLDNPQKEDLPNPIGYNLFSNLKTSPESISNLSASNFTFSSDNENIAKIDKTGAVTFSQPGEATFTAVYTRDTTKKVSKTINCTYNNFLDAAFSSNTYSATIDSLPSTKIIDSTALDYYVYPEPTYASRSVILDSSNVDVIRPVWNSTRCKYDLQVNQPGTTLLTVSVITGIKDMPVKMDSCLVTIGLDKDSIVKEDVVTLNDSYYYALRNNINTSIRHPATPAVSFELETTDIAYIDNDEILHFKESGEVKVYATVDFESGEVTKEFTVTCNEHINEINVDKTIETYKAGQRCKIVSTESYQPTFNGCEDKFDVTTDDQGNKIFIAKHGCSFEHFELKNSSGKTKEIAITFTEDPLYVKSEKSAYETVDNTKSYPLNFKEWANPTIFPTTATKNDGTNYELSYSYDVQTEEVASVEGDDITFLAPGIVQATVSWDDKHYYSFNIKSTYGKLGRIKMFERDGLVDWAEFHNGKAFTLAPNGTLELRTNVMYYSEYEQLKATSLNNMCSVKIDSDASELVQRHSYITITAHDNVYGSDVIKIETGTYTFYINVNISPVIQSIKVFNFGKEITKDTKTYTTNLKDLDIVVGPTSAHGQTYNVTFNGITVTPTKGSVYDKLDLSGQTWNQDKANTLVFTNSEGTTIGEYSMLYSTATPTITVEGSTEYQTENNDTKKGIFLPANANQRSLLLSTDGFVESSFWSKITSELVSTEKGETTSVSGNLLSISQIPEPDFSIYENTLILKNDGSKIAEYTIGRDFVTKIVLPKHDNNDKTDKKGLQKVHVYGNCSYYNPTEGMIDYYKLPIQLFNYKHEKIGDDGTEEGKTLKALAYSTLLPSINNNCEAQYDSENGFVKIYFKNNVFSLEEIAANAFDTKELGKKVKFDIHTMSTVIDANYTFVPVSGVNCYCQEGLLAVKNEQQPKGVEPSMVLQTNFGLEDGTPDNQPLTDGGITDCNCAIYGNGYSFCLAYLIKQVGAAGLRFGAGSVFNAQIIGNYEEMEKNTNTALIPKETKEHLNFNGLYYMTYRDFPRGICPDLVGDCKFTFKNDLFYRNLQTSLNLGGIGDRPITVHPKCYFEDCAFLNAGSFPLIGMLDTPIYFKGNMPIYNFRSKDMLNHLFGQDLRILWPALLKAAQLSHMTQFGADGQEYINSFMVTALNKNIYFYNPETGEYEKGTAGREGAINHMSKYIDIHIPLTSIEASMWASVNPNHEQGAPDYWDAYDHDGNMKPTFFNSQVKKLFRHINYF